MPISVSAAEMVLWPCKDVLSRKGFCNTTMSTQPQHLGESRDQPQQQFCQLGLDQATPAPCSRQHSQAPTLAGNQIACHVDGLQPAWDFAGIMLAVAREQAYVLCWQELRTLMAAQLLDRRHSQSCSHA